MSLELENAVSSGLNRMRGGDQATFSQSVLFPQKARALDLFPGGESLSLGMPFMCTMGFSFRLQMKS